MATTPNTEKTSKRDFRQDLTNQIIELIEEGTAPFQKPWKADEAAAFLRLPLNASTGRAYRGGNSLYLMAVATKAYGSTDNRWCTYKQAEAEGWQIKKGSKGIPVEYWNFDKEEKRLNPTTGKEEIVRIKFEKPRVFYATVFHASQIEGIPPLEPVKKPEGWDAITEAEKILKNSGAKIFHDQLDKAFYSSSKDEIHLPPKASFPQALDYYEVALHELAHWTGHSSRLNRDLSGGILEMDKSSYAREELRAQMASLYLSAELGVPFNPESHASYQSSWLSALKSDKNEIFKAARDAEVITEYVLDLSRVKEVDSPNVVNEKALTTKDVVNLTESIKRLNFEGVGRNETQEAVARAVEENPNLFIERFKALPQSLNGRFISADTFKETFDQYKESNETRNIFNTPVHNSAAVLAAEQFKRVLQETPEENQKYVVLLTGAPGSGKTSSVLDHGSLPNKIHAIYEGQLADPENAIAKVQQVLDAGFKPVIVVSHALPEKALDNALQRFEEIGRGASINAIAKIQGGLPEGLAAVRNKFGDAVEFKIRDRRDFLNPIRLQGWEHLPLLSSEGNYERIKQRLEKHLESIRDRLPNEAYRHAAGLSPRVRETSNERNSGESSERESGTRSGDGRIGQLLSRERNTPLNERSAPQRSRNDAGLSASQSPVDGLSQSALKTPQPAQKQSNFSLVSESDKVTAALAYVSPNDRETWVKMAMAVKNGLGDSGFSIWDQWSQQSENYKSADAKSVWASTKTGRGIELGTLYYEAKQNGFDLRAWKTQESPTKPIANTAEQNAKREAEAAKVEANYKKAAEKAFNVFSKARPLDAESHPYLIKKGVAELFGKASKDTPNTPRVLEAAALSKILGYAPKADGIPLAGQILVLPVFNDIELSTLEFIDESGRKSALAGGKKSGAWFAPLEIDQLTRNLIRMNDAHFPTVIVEGVATALSVHKGLNPNGLPPQAYVVAALSDTNLKNVAQALKELRPNAPIIVGADSNSIQKAHDAAATVGGRFAYPAFENNAQLNGTTPTDFNDLMIIDAQKGKSEYDFYSEISKVFEEAKLAVEGKEWTEALLPTETKIKEQLKMDQNESKFYINPHVEIEELNKEQYEDLVLSFAEETTSSKGVAPKIHIREENWFEVQFQNPRDSDGYWRNEAFETESKANEFLLENKKNGEVVEINEVPRYEVWTYGTGGNNPHRLSAHDTLKEAQAEVLRCAQIDFDKADGAPQIFATKKDAENHVKEIEKELATLEVEVATPAVNPPTQQSQIKGDSKMEASKPSKSNEPIFKVSELSEKLVNTLKERYGAMTRINAPRENGSYTGEIYDVGTHLVQEVSSRNVVVHDKTDMKFIGTTEKAHSEGKLSGWELGIHYKDKAPAVYPHDPKKEMFDWAANQITRSLPESERSAFEATTKKAWANFVEERRERAMAPTKKADAPKPVEQAKPAEPEAAKPAGKKR